MDVKHGNLVTGDGVRLSYLEAGSGKPLVMIPGWSQTAEQFKYQIEGLGDRYRVIAIDMRGHGDSEKVSHGYKIQRLSMDVHDALQALGLTDVTLLGHSMGCSVIWGYWELFGSEHLSRIVLVDEPPFLTANPAWSQAELDAAGAIFTPESVTQTYNDLNGPNAAAVTEGFVGGMFTTHADPEKKAWAVQLNFKLPRIHAATLLWNHCHQDWRDVIPRITVPTLVVGGRVSVVPWKSVQWIAEQIVGSDLVIFEEEEGGQHFMFIENPEKFNRAVADFMG